MWMTLLLVLTMGIVAYLIYDRKADCFYKKKLERRADADFAYAVAQEPSEEE